MKIIGKVIAVWEKVSLILSVVQAISKGVMVTIEELKKLNNSNKKEDENI